MGERRRMQKTSGGKIRKKVTGESLSSYYEEQKGGKKVEIGGKKGGYREQGMGSVGDAKEGATRVGGSPFSSRPSLTKKALEKGKGASSPFGREWKKRRDGKEAEKRIGRGPGVECAYLS